MAESWLSPRVHRDCHYITVSEASKRELQRLGVDAARIAVVPNGCTPSAPISRSASHHWRETQRYASSLSPVLSPTSNSNTLSPP
ncbi:MAG: glycosyltransferase [Lawsonella clevelandensis]